MTYSHAVQPHDRFFGVALYDVESSNIGRIGYDEEVSRLYVQFRDQRAGTRDGAIYEYEGVPHVEFRRLIAANNNGESVGCLFNERIKRGGYPFRKVVE